MRRMLSFSCRIVDRANFDPITAGTLILSGIGAGVSAAGTIAGGNSQAAAATQAGNNAVTLSQMQQNQDNYQAAQVEENASSEIGAAQRQMLDTQQRTRLAQSTLTANAGGSGFVATTGSPAALSQSIARRGSYEAAMNLFQGENAATGDLNRAQGLIYSGDIALEGGRMEQQADQMKADSAIQSSRYAAIGNLASAGGNMFKMYGGGSGSPLSSIRVGNQSFPAYG